MASAGLVGSIVDLAFGGAVSAGGEVDRKENRPRTSQRKKASYIAEETGLVHRRENRPRTSQTSSESKYKTQCLINEISLLKTSSRTDGTRKKELQTQSDSGLLVASARTDEIRPKIRLSSFSLLASSVLDRTATLLFTGLDRLSWLGGLETRPSHCRLDHRRSSYRK